MTSMEHARRWCDRALPPCRRDAWSLASLIPPVWNRVCGMFDNDGL